MAQPVAYVISKPDTLGPEIRKFAQAPLRQTAFLNSVPKCGTHLLRNIVRMFVPIEQHYDREFIQIPNFQQHVGALNPARPTFSVGHLLFSDMSLMALKHARQVVLVRDPYDYVLARARFSLSDQFDHPELKPLKNGAVSVEQMMNMMIFGIPGKGPALREVFTFHAVAWLGTGVKLVRYEDIIGHLKNLEAPAAEAYFGDLLAHLGIALPDDWRARVAVGAAREHSATSREKLSGGMALPEVLPDDQKRAVDFMAPGLRELLGYA
ncbi:hypothetical protein JKL49_07675 [Phenylobacterium sp. 20VBR1]|uniref:Sulfotransferase domain-containing protein n=1 Tax=Phenylobacterium glaciei TaxID=2803784 RepID=A0A941D0H8_9CAUL|nr:hypothetical protein [Phenylobacterium glaciei]MBR7619267.1 hypothetical protein [Phenylobacterium glaciei]